MKVFELMNVYTRSKRREEFLSSWIDLLNSFVLV